jgi:hypothetical protein
VTKDQPIACNLSALNGEEQCHRAELAMRLRESVHEIAPIANSYVFRFVDQGAILIELAEFIALEHRCCPFLNFQINLSPNEKSISFQLSGRAGVKEFLAAELGINTIDGRG